MKNSAIATTVLVTGGTGYVRLQCILQLLQEGYTVKTTIRSLEKKRRSLLRSKQAASAMYPDHIRFRRILHSIVNQIHH